MNRKFHFLNSGRTHEGVPIIASNMDTVGTFEMAAALAAHGCYTCVHKYYTPDQWEAFAKGHPDAVPYAAVSAGTSDADFANLSEVLARVPDLAFICLDVANGYSEHFVQFVARVRKAFPTHTIMAGNVVTGEMTEALVFAGADIITSTPYIVTASINSQYVDFLRDQ